MVAHIWFQNKLSLIHFEVRIVCFVMTWGSVEAGGFEISSVPESLGKTWTLQVCQ